MMYVYQRGNCIRYPITKCFVYRLGVVPRCHYDEAILPNDLTACIYQGFLMAKGKLQLIVLMSPPYETIEPI